MRTHCVICYGLCEVASFPRPIGPTLPALARNERNQPVCDPCNAVTV